MNIRTAGAGDGLKWITEGFQLFTRNAGMWVVLAVLMLVGTLIVALIPILGSLALALFWPVLVGGLLLGCRDVDNGRALQLPHLYAGFQSGARMTQLVLVGVAYLVVTFVLMAIIMATVGMPMLQGMRPGSAHGMAGAGGMGAMLIALLVGLAVLVPVAMAIWFAPSLILFNALSAVEAMKQSFAACLRNIVPFLVYGVIAFVLSLIAAIPFGLGFIVLIPVMVCSVYVSYKALFDASPAPANAASPATNPLLR